MAERSGSNFFIIEPMQSENDDSCQRHPSYYPEVGRPQIDRASFGNAQEAESHQESESKGEREPNVVKDSKKGFQRAPFSWPAGDGLATRRRSRMVPDIRCFCSWTSGSCPGILSTPHVNLHLGGPLGVEVNSDSSSTMGMVFASTPGN